MPTRQRASMPLALSRHPHQRPHQRRADDCQGQEHEGADQKEQAAALRCRDLRGDNRGGADCVTLPLGRGGGR